MATKAQIAAHRRNAKQSTGPRTAEGKVRASRTAMKHGLLARDVVIFGESEEAYEALRDDVFDEVEPVGVQEEALAEAIVVCSLKSRRGVRIEASTFRHEAFDQQVAHAKRRVNKLRKSVFGALGDQGKVVTDQVQLDAALAQLEKAVTARNCEMPALAFESAAKRNDCWTKLSRYKVANERSLYRAYRELERLQAIRKAREIDVIDVTPSSREE